MPTEIIFNKTSWGGENAEPEILPNGKIFENRRLKKKLFPSDSERFMKIYANKSIRATSLSAEIAMATKYSGSRNPAGGENPYHLATDGLEPRGSYRHLSQSNMRQKHQSIDNVASDHPEFLSASSRIIGQ